MTTSDPDAWVAVRVEALESANNLTVEKIASIDAAFGDLYRRCQELEQVVHRLEAAFAERGAFAAAAPPAPDGSTL